MMTDPIADMLTRIRNGLNAKHTEVTMPASKMKHRIALILKEEGFIDNVELIGEGTGKSIVIKLKYAAAKKPVIADMSRISKLSCRTYLTKDEVKSVRHGRGIAILSTSKGIMKDSEARKHGIGGELLFTVW